MSESIFQTLVLSGLFGTLGLILGRWRRVPSLLFYLAFGLLAGPMVFNWIRPGDLGDAIMPGVEIAVAVIIFEAGLGLPLSGLKTAPKAIRRTLTVLLAITGALSTLVAKYLVGLPWSVSLLFGSIILVTGPTVINPLLKSLALSRKIEVLLRWESVWADCVGVVLSGVVLEGVLYPETAGLGLSASFLFRMAAGMIFGVASGWLLGRWVLPWISRLGDSTLPGIVALSGAVGVFFGSNILVHGSGVISAAAAGMTLTRYPLPELENIKHFKDQVTTILVAFLFVLLSAQIDFTTSTVSLWSIVAASAILTFLIRPFSSLLGLWRTSLSVPERLFVGLTGPRGIISAAIVSYYVFLLAEKIPEIEEMRLLTFATILLSGGFVSLFGKTLAGRLRVNLNEYLTGIALIGIGPFSLRFAKLLNRYVEVILLDSDPFKCNRLTEEGLVGKCGNALGDELYEELIETGFRRALICTPNGALNFLIARKAAAHFGVNRVFTIAPPKCDTLPYPPMGWQKMAAFSIEGLAIETIGEDLIKGSARVDLLDENQATPDSLPLALETPGQGIRLLRAENAESGRGIYLTRIHLNGGE